MDYVLCLDSIGKTDHMFLHVSKPPKEGTPAFSLVEVSSIYLIHLLVCSIAEHFWVILHFDEPSEWVKYNLKVFAEAVRKTRMTIIAMQTIANFYLIKPSENQFKWFDLWGKSYSESTTMMNWTKTTPRIHPKFQIEWTPLQKVIISSIIVYLHVGLTFCELRHFSLT